MGLLFVIYRNSLAHNKTIIISLPLCTWANPQTLAQEAAKVTGGSGVSGLAASSPAVSAEVMDTEEQASDLRPQVLLPSRRLEARLHAEQTLGGGWYLFLL